MELWSQTYDPLNNTILSTLVCAIPVLVLLGGLGIFKIKAHYAAIAGLIAAVGGKRREGSTAGAPLFAIGSNTNEPGLPPKGAAAAYLTAMAVRVPSL